MGKRVAIFILIVSIGLLVVNLIRMDYQNYELVALSGPFSNVLLIFVAIVSIKNAR